MALPGYRTVQVMCIGDCSVGKTCILISNTCGAFPGEYIPVTTDVFAAGFMVDHKPIGLIWVDTECVLLQIITSNPRPQQQMIL